MNMYSEMKRLGLGNYIKTKWKLLVIALVIAIVLLIANSMVSDFIFQGKLLDVLFEQGATPAMNLLYEVKPSKAINDYDKQIIARAQQLIDQGQVEKVADALAQIPKNEQYKEVVYQSRYETALTYMQQGRYDESIEILKLIPDYKDVREKQYQIAQKYIENQQYDKALSIVNTMLEYKEATEMKYQIGIAYREIKEFDKAITIFNDLQNYKDGKVYKTETIYEKAVDLMNRKEYSNATMVLAEIKGYKDTEELIYKSKYQEALQLMENLKYEDASKILQEIPDYSNAKENLLECRYQIAYKILDDIKNTNYIEANLGAYTNTKLIQARDSFYALTDYKNSRSLYEVIVQALEWQGTWKQTRYNPGKNITNTNAGANPNNYLYIDYFNKKIYKSNSGVNPTIVPLEFSEKENEKNTLIGDSADFPYTRSGDTITTTDGYSFKRDN